MIQTSHLYRLLLIILICTAIYYPGLEGGFLLDDFGNLGGLSAVTQDNAFEQLSAYILNGVAGATGRPISLLSFALQWQSWPDNPFNFKLINLFIHVMNGVLIYLLSHQILNQHQKVVKHAKIISTLAMTLWLLHPIQISTVLYVVQRMTELSALFTLGGITLYLYGRNHQAKLGFRRSYLFMTLGVGVALTLGIASKENAVLICLFILVLEATVLHDAPRPQYWELWRIFFLVAPLAILTLYLLPNIIEYAFTDYPTRSFSATERLFIQSHVLWDYINNIVLPRPNSFGLLRADYSVTIFSVSTIIKSTLLVLLILFAWFVRKIYPFISLGILWFFAGHALESTALNLELYFEHRNYVSLWGMLVALLAGGSILYQKLEQQGHSVACKTLIGSGILWLFIVPFITINEIKLWGDPMLQATIWAENHPQSLRARSYLGFLLTQHNQPEMAKENYKHGVEYIPNEINMLLNWQELQCIKGDIELPPKEQLLNLVSTGNHNNAVLLVLNEILDLKYNGECKQLDNGLFEEILERLKTNPNYQTQIPQRNILTTLGKYYLLTEDDEKAIYYLKQAFLIKNSPDQLITIANLQAKQENKENYLMTVSQLYQYCEANKKQCLKYQNDLRFHLESAASLTDRKSLYGTGTPQL